LHVGEAGFLAWRSGCALTDVHGLVAIGGHRGAERRSIQRLFEQHNIMIPSVTHPTAFVAASARLGAGTQVLAQSAVCADAQLGAACIVNTRASVDHECRLGDGVHIAPGAILAGCVCVGENTLVGAGAVVLPRIRIGGNAIVGAGAVVTRDVDDGCTVSGNPARVTGHSSS
jgi:sugar O-acyltransferase (sialic acid O-acetyltransferase NeuD family)